MIRAPRALRRAAIVLVALAASGCSFRLVHPAPVRADWPAQVTAHDSEVACTSTPAPPIADAGLFAAGAALTYIERTSGSPPFTVGIALASLPFLASAIYGTVQVSRCRQYQSIFR